MLRDRILSTLRFFDLQDYPLTLLELHKFLLADVEGLKQHINTQWELIGDYQSGQVGVDQIIQCLKTECRNEIVQQNGFFCLAGRQEIIRRRQQSYFYGIKRQRLIRRFAKGLRHLPFVRGVALAGSQALGAQKADSDIDLLIIVDPKFLWLARTAVTAYFQVLGRRRHGQKIADRFCLNHYLAGVKTIAELRNLYTACEYAKLLSLVYPQVITEFQQKNRGWIAAFLPNFEPMLAGEGQPSSAQKFLERMLGGKFGQWLERRLKNWQLPKIRQEQFILVRDDELSFHPQSKQRKLLQRFFIG